ncbi:MAG: hypothetical protein JWN99_83 [Ilumatobacteraceae bacterium]|nr:hypothetical protein [Ilumatobacteraceae bacterium]
MVIVTGSSITTRWVARLMVVATPLLTIALACGSSQPDRSVAAYCTQVQGSLATLNTPAIATATDVQRTIDLYRTIGDHAPAAVQPEWQTMIDSLETAASLVPGDPEQVAAVNDAALSSQSAATRIQQYTKTQCGADIGTPPLPTNPVTVTTVAPPSTT